MMKIARFFRLFPVALFAIALGCDNPVEDDHGHADDVVGVRISTADGTRIASYAAGEWSIAVGDALTMHIGEELAWRISLVDVDGDIVELDAEHGEHTLQVEAGDEAVLTIEPAGDLYRVTARGEGTTDVKVRLMHGGHADFETSPGVQVVVAPA